MSIRCRCNRLLVRAGLPFLLMCSISAASADSSDSIDRSADCGPWAFAEEGPSPGEAIEPAAYLPCGDDYAIILQCLVSDFIANFRYYPVAEEGDGYRLFRFAMQGQDIEFWLRVEGLDGAWAGYREFAHPLFEAMKGAQALEVTDLVSGRTEILPMENAGASIEALLGFC